MLRRPAERALIMPAYDKARGRLALDEWEENYAAGAATPIDVLLTQIAAESGGADATG
jgi:hypothetical protein